MMSAVHDILQKSRQILQLLEILAPLSLPGRPATGIAFFIFKSPRGLIWKHDQQIMREAVERTVVGVYRKMGVVT